MHFPPFQTFHPFSCKKDIGPSKFFLSFILSVGYCLMPKWWACTVSISRDPLKTETVWISKISAVQPTSSQCHYPKMAHQECIIPTSFLAFCLR
jgi:hypothetical protein